MTPFIPSSLKLTELEQKRDTLKVKAKAAHTEVIRFSKARYPTQWHDSTVVRVTDVDAPTATLIGFKRQRDELAVKTIGTSEEDEAAHKQEVLRRVLAGEQMVNEFTPKETLEKAQSDWAAYETGIDFINKEIEKEKNILYDQYAKSLVPMHHDKMTKLCSTLLEAHAAWSDVYGIKRNLIDSGVGLRHGLCNTLPESFLGTPVNPYSDMAAWFTEAKRQGFLKEVPAPLRMKVAK